MRLVSAHITGYGRLVDAKVNLDSKVIAVVGPNEAGKTTFLKALAYLDSGAALSLIERSRATNVAGNTSVVEVKFALDDDDRLPLQRLDLEELPRTMYASRMADGGDVQIQTEPRPRKAIQSLKKSLAVLEKAAERKSLQALVSKETIFGDPEVEGARDFQVELQQLVQSVRRIVGSPQDSSSENEAAGLAGDLASAVVADSKADRLRDALSSAKVWLERDNPSAAVNSALWARTPDFVLFDEADRSLQSTYTLDDALLAAIPAALRNLTRMAGLDLHATVVAHRSGDIARRDSAIVQSNNRLRDLFRETWKQSKLSVQVSVDGDLLRISIIENDKDVTVFGERSAGLRMFVALVAFLSTWT